MLGMDYVILLWYSLSLPYNYFGMLHRELDPIIVCSNNGTGDNGALFFQLMTLA